MKTDTLFSFELRESVPFFLEQNENFIMIHFEASSIPPKPLADADLPPWKTIMAELAIMDEEETAIAKAQGMTKTAGVEPVEVAAEMGDVASLQALAEELKSQSSALVPLCDNIVKLAEDFDFDGIVKLADDLEA